MQHFFTQINTQKRSYISVKHDSCIILLVYRRNEYKIAIQQDITYFRHGAFYLINISLFVHTNTAILIIL